MSDDSPVYVEFSFPVYTLSFQIQESRVKILICQAYSQSKCVCLPAVPRIIMFCRVGVNYLAWVFDFVLVSLTLSSTYCEASDFEKLLWLRVLNVL